MIDWGNGDAATAATVDATTKTFSATYTYLDDGATPGNSTPSDIYTITATVTDDDTLSDTASATLTVNNVAPVVNPLSLSATTINENGSVTVTGSYTDMGTLDTHTVMIDWGNGEAPTAATVDATTRTFSATYTYLDDGATPGNSTPSDSYTITATVTDDDTLSDTASATLTVYNIAPMLSNILVTSAIDEDGIATLSGTITDPGTLDAHTLTVNWGEGAPQTYELAAGVTTFSVTHQYLDDNPTGTASDVYTITGTLTDDDGGSVNLGRPAIANGSFETADYSGWTLLEIPVTTPLFGTWGIATNDQIINYGESTFDFFDSVFVTQGSPGLPHTYTATDGNFLAYQLQNAPQFHRMYQDVAIPVGANTLSWDMEYTNHYGIFVPNAQELAVQIRDLGDNILQTLYVTAGADPQSIPMTAFSADIAAYAGTTVRISVDQNVQIMWFDSAFDNFFISGAPSLELTINNVAPVAASQYISTDENNPAGTFNVLNGLTDQGIQDTHAAEAASGTTANGGIYTIATNGDATYDPNGQFEYLAEGQPSTDSFTYIAVDDDGGTASATVFVTITGRNDAPVANPDTYSTDEDTTLTIAASGVLGNDTDVDNDPLTAVLVSGPSNGSLMLNADGSFSYTPDTDFNGSDSFSYKANDGALDSADTTVTITVTPVNDAPVGDVTLTAPTPLKTTDTVSASPNFTDADGIPSGPGDVVLQWQSTVDGLAWTDIAGATGASLFLDYSLAGLLVRAQARYTDLEGTFETVDSLASEPIRLFWTGTRFNDSKSGTPYNDSMNGADGADLLSGLDGDDWLNGGKGNDSMRGGLGDDTYFVDNSNDLILENAGEGYDHVQASSSYSLKDKAAHVEKLSLSGTGNNNATGNDLDNLLVGNNGNNVLDGGLGKDTMIGDFGNDIYIIDDPGDVVIETIWGGTSDEIRSPLSTVLPEHVEHLTLTGSAAVHGTGNGANNRIKGNAAANTLLGLLGNDELEGGDGTDILDGGLGNDKLKGGNGGDHFRFSSPLLLIGGLPSTDTITDFKGSDADRIVLSSSVFSAISAAAIGVGGVLNASAFLASLSGAATTSDHRLLYNTSTGLLSYDSDGTGAAAAYGFAQLTGKPSLNNSWILVQSLP
ncbi:MAG: tandem-95 repeat protein [Synechococcaceae cyanobacterium]|nr:tandem-95 repeat protein [Synechococcaceae cyanobacterium]